MQCEVLNHKEEQSISKELHESGCQEVVTCRFGASKGLGSPCSGMFPTERVKIETTDGSCSKQKEYDLIVLVHGDIRPVENGSVSLLKVNIYPNFETLDAIIAVAWKMISAEHFRVKSVLDISDLMSTTLRGDDMYS